MTTESIFTPQEHASISAYMLMLAHELNLGSWDIALELTQTPINARASCNTTEGMMRARIYLDRGWRTWTKIELRYLLTHELLHCHFENVWDVIESDLLESELLGKATMVLLDNHFSRQMEYLVDQMARLMAPYLPLIEVIEPSPQTDAE